MSNPQKFPRTVSELFPSKWLKPHDLNGRSVTVTIRGVLFDQFQKHPRTQETELKAFLDFGRSKFLILNPTQARAIEGILGTEAFEGWIGKKIMLTAAKSHNNKDTIRITAPPAETITPSGSDKPTGRGETAGQPLTQTAQPTPPAVSPTPNDKTPSSTDECEHGFWVACPEGCN